MLCDVDLLTEVFSVCCACEFILRGWVMSERTFVVDEVKANDVRLPEVETTLDAWLGCPLRVASHDTLRLVDEQLAAELSLGMGADRVARGRRYGRVHPLFGAVHVAFARHYPLVWDPDSVWITILQGVARHMACDHEALRERLVQHHEKKALRVVTMSLATREDWIAAWEALQGAIHEHTRTPLDVLFTRPFSTTGVVEQTVTRIILMDAVQHYFDYKLVCICGIPTVTLRGTLEDWKDLRARVRALDELGLSWWTHALEPLCDH